MAIKILPKEEKFYQLFDKQAELISKGGILLNKAIEDNKYDQDLMEKLSALTKECDELTLTIIQKNLDTFITPFDREDIQQFANAGDDIVDSIYNLARSAKLFKVKKKHHELTRLGVIIEKSVSRIEEIVKMLKKKDQAPTILKSCHKVKRFRNEGELVIDEIMPSLLQDDDMADLFRWKEIMDKSKELLVRCEKYVLIIETMLIKNV